MDGAFYIKCAYARGLVQRHVDFSSCNLRVYTINHLGSHPTPYALMS